jgi:hypothetical protein
MAGRSGQGRSGPFQAWRRGLAAVSDLPRGEACYVDGEDASRA